MQLDSTIEIIICKIQRLFIKKFDKAINREDLLYIINSQFKSIANAMKDEEAIKLDKLGKFLQKEGRIKALKSKKDNNF